MKRQNKAAANAIKYSRRQLASNADHYEEPGPELGPDGMYMYPFIKRLDGDSCLLPTLHAS